MIHVFYGENEFLKRQKVHEIVGSEPVRRRDGEDVSVGDLRELLMGQTLFGSSEPIIFTDLSQNIEAWSIFPDIAKKSDTTIILLETKLDKRTKTYKSVVQHAMVMECTPLAERQKPELIQWGVTRSKKQGVRLNAKQVEMLIDRLGFDQLRLDSMFEQLALADEVTDEIIDQCVPVAKAESVFALLDRTVHGDVAAVHRIVAYVETTSGDDGAYQTMGLLASQITNLFALVLSDGDTQAVTKDFGAHPFALRQLMPLARRLNQSDMAYISSTLAKADTQMKTTGVAPWLPIEAALVKIANYKK